MKFLGLAASFLIGLTVAQDAAAQQITGNQLYDACQGGGDSIEFGFCAGYIASAIESQKWGAFVVLERLDPIENAEDADARANVLLGYCIPAGVSNKQARDVAMKYLQDNPASRHEPARFLVWQALFSVFPCAE